ncbi:hypothetical protein ACOIXD_004507 [Vibrio parahaemolyticus]|uniref:hypothetical protein n=1 Tax=Vibrio vulnificus TaxID=672 RepID=UPI001EEBF5E8|nr:hypothetical protein [Vibrio vulnificus]EHR4996375.1 hypothetical protein [Vibrio parahaemolyticus]EHR6686493.1 hypothetical protein [Vibrio parahaemolyticus]EIV8488351.1 hypothetical protein [Vibrio parahaemolyticus]MCG6262629.1 hypothetical protein [Vibrio vulnificus]
MNNQQLAYVLYGASNTGKTSALRFFAQKLDQISTLVAGGIEPDYDFSVVFELKGKRIGVITAGDDEASMVEGFELIDKHNCEIVFCASRTKGQTTDFLYTRYQEEQFRWVSNMFIYNVEQQQINKCKESVANFMYESLLVELRA